MSKKIIYIDMDDTLCDYASAHQLALKLYSEIQFPQSKPGFFHDLLPITGGIEAMRQLLASQHYDPFILTAPSVMNPLCYTEKRTWVETHLGMDYVHRLIISPRKDLLKGDFLIDDYNEGKGQELFTGKVLHFGTDPFQDWASVRAFLGI
jgi:5'-nucleotidase